MKDLIRKILKEDIRDKLISQIDKSGLYNFMKMSKMSYSKIYSIIGDEWITNKIMIDFIKKVVKSYGSFSVDEIGYEPIFYGQTEDELKEISYFSSNGYVFVDVYSGNSNLGNFRVHYENLPDNKLRECFDMLMDAFEEGVFD